MNIHEYQAKQLLEEDVLLIKNTLDRHRKYANHAHAEAMSMLANKIKSILRLDHVSYDNQKFLEIVLKDYVMLTR